MLIFALVGGSVNAREEVTKQFAKHIGGSGVIYSMPDSIPQARRLSLLKNQFNPRGNSFRILLLNQLSELAEFEWVRSVGGYVVHVDGLPSNVVPMKEDDLYVTARKSERGRFDTVEQCFAELKLRQQLRAERRSKRPFSETER